MTQGNAASWRTYEVTVPGYGTEMVAAKSAAGARYRAYLDAFDGLTFAEFLRLGVTVRLVRGAIGPGRDGYAYIRRTYGVDVRIGDTVRLRNEGGASGALCPVIYPGSSTAHVHVIFDGQPVIVHPLHVERVGPGVPPGSG